MHRSCPLEVGRWRKAELVGQIAFLVPFFIPLRFIQRSNIRAELIVVVFEAVFHPKLEQVGS